MTLQASTAIRAAQANQVDGVIGASAQLIVYSGAEPANPAAAPTGTVLVTMALPSTWLTSPGTGVKAMSGTWSGVASASGTAGYFRIYDNGITTCGLQGNVTLTGGGGDVTINATSITNGQTITATGFTLTVGNP